MDDVLLDTLARTLAGHRLVHVFRSDTREYEWHCVCEQNSTHVTDYETMWWGFHRHFADEVLAVTGDDGVPLLSLASDWEAIGSIHWDETLGFWCFHQNGDNECGDPLVFRRRSSVTGTEETNAWRNARGALSGDEPAEVIIRRGRDGV